MGKRVGKALVVESDHSSRERIACAHTVAVVVHEKGPLGGFAM
jgi:hypothetical protein